MSTFEISSATAKSDFANEKYSRRYLKVLMEEHSEYSER